ncbi:hypothetical protein [Kribbella sindirgiensis]|uniref:Uncharacterized protein n=1 Tax=Kribbella sindirgiensis TaxID=1124744 RepID=A0A4R0IJV5_9ACTN|nr:hypothetical protein [Kribbella sindirgiensis]TCC31398.1 hypothetical protein E0H50_22265 [Kribbella sindirgiensis]
MADRIGADHGARSSLDQAAADGSITQARTRAVDPVPIVTEPLVARSATLEPVLETNESDMGVNTSVNPEAQAVDGTADGTADGSTAAAPVAGARRRLSPRPVPVSRRRRPPAAVATDEERTPAEEMDDVGTQDEKAESNPAAEAGKAETTPATETGTGGPGTATATKTARPKTAAEIVAEQRAREKAAAETPATDAAGSEDAAPGRPDGTATSAATSAATDAGKDAGTGAADKPAAAAAGTPAGKPTGASGNKPAAKSSSGPGMGKQALTSVGSGVRKLRNLIASLIWLAAVLAAAVLALGALFTALDQTNQSNEIVRWILERGHDLVGPFKDLFRLETAKNTLLVNWGIAALVYLIAGKIVEKIVRP